jgi:hypothetical protein
VANREIVYVGIRILGLGIVKTGRKKERKKGRIGKDV